MQAFKTPIKILRDSLRKGGCFQENKLCIINMARAITGQFHEVDKLLCDLTRNGDIYRVEGEYEEFNEVFYNSGENPLKLPLYRLTRKHLNLLRGNGIKVKDVAEYGKSVVNSVEIALKEMKLFNLVDEIRIAGKGVYSKSVNFHPVISVKFKDDISVELLSVAWATLFLDKSYKRGSRLVHVCVGGKWTTDFIDSHVIIFRNGESCLIQDELSEDKCSDAEYLNFLQNIPESNIGFLINGTSHNEISSILRYQYEHTVGAEIYALSVACRGEHIPLSLVSKDLLASYRLCSIPLSRSFDYSYHRDKDPINKYLLAYMVESGWLTEERKGDMPYICSAGTPGYGSNAPQIESSDIALCYYNGACQKIEGSKQSLKDEKVAAKARPKSNERWVAIYLVHTEPMTLVGFRRCTNRTKNLSDKYVERYVKYKPGREDNSYAYGRVIVEDCDQDQIDVIQNACKEHDVGNVSMFYIKDDKCTPDKGRFDSWFSGEENFTSFDLRPFMKSRKVLCVNSGYLTNDRDFNVDDYYTNDEINVLKDRVFPKGTLGELVFELKVKMDMGYKLYSNGHDKFINNLSFDRGLDGSAVISIDGKHGDLFNITIKDASLVISAGNESKSMDEEIYLSQHISIQHFFSSLVDRFQVELNSLRIDLDDMELINKVERELIFL